MKSLEFKKLIREAVREEIGEILLEALKENMANKGKTNIQETYRPSSQPTQSQQSQPGSVIPQSPNEKRKMYEKMILESSPSYNTQQQFNPQGVEIGGDLPSGDVNMDSIKSLLTG